MLYRATAKLSGGRQVQSEPGTFAQCAAWADQIRETNGGEVTVRITRVAEAEA